MKELKKIGHNIDLKKLVIHRIIKEAGVRTASVKLAPHEIKVTENEKTFIGKITKAYFSKSNPIYGVFDNDISNEFQNSLEKQLLENNDFVSFTREAMYYYKRVITTSAPATGGFVLFSNYVNTDNGYEYLLVITINNKDGYYVDESSLTVENIKNLDLNKVDVASNINITKWKSINAGVDIDSKTYLSFVKGNKDVSYYFMSFIGCENKTTASDSTKKLTRAIDRFCKVKKYDRTEEVKIKNLVYAYCIECIKKKQEISLVAISAILNPEKPDEFKEYASSEDFSVDPIISGDKTKLKILHFIQYKSTNLTIEFNNDLLGKQVVYSPRKKQLIIKDVPTSLIEQIPGANGTE